MSAGAAGGAGAAAAAEAERQRQEEEEMSGYSGRELAEGWEFKILRSHTGRFRKPEKLRAALDEEKRGGWTLVEKFDDGRIRLKRPAGTKVVEGDLADNYDPYRTTLGPTPGVIVALVFGILGAVFMALILLLLVVRAADRDQAAQLTPPPPAAPFRLPNPPNQP